MVDFFNWKGLIGLGFPAVVQNGIVLTAANIDQSWIGIPINEYLSKITGCEVYTANDADVALAVQAAKRAAPAWRALSGEDRARYLYRIARILLERSREFACLETLDNGKPIRESRNIDVPLAIRHFYYHAGMAQLMDEELPDAQALGVCGQIIPWNFPILNPARKLAPALAAGNCVVLKPAEQTPTAIMVLAELIGGLLPPGQGVAPTQSP